MVKVKVINKEDKEIEDVINDWLSYKQSDNTINFTLLDIKMVVTDMGSVNKHGRSYMVATLIYDENRDKVPPSNPAPGLGQW